MTLGTWQNLFVSDSGDSVVFDIHSVPGRKINARVSARMHGDGREARDSSAVARSSSPRRGSAWGSLIGFGAWICGLCPRPQPPCTHLS